MRGLEWLWIVLGTAAAGVIALIVYAIMAGLRRRRALAAFSRELGLPHGSYRALESEGVAYHAGYFPRTRDTAAALKVSVPCATPGTFEIRRQNGFDRLGTLLRLTLKIATGDPEFDRRFFILTDVPRTAATFIDSEGARRAISEIFDLGYNRLVADGGNLEARWMNFGPTRAPDSAVVPNAAYCLSFLALEAPRTLLDPVPTRSMARWLLFGSAIAIVVLSFVMFLVDPWPPVHGGELFYPAMHGGWPLLAAFLVVGYFSLRGRTRSHGDFTWFLVAAGAAFLLGGYQGSVAANALLDRGPTTIHRRLIHRKETYLTSGKNPHWVYKIYVSSWRPLDEHLLFDISNAEYQVVIQGRTHLILETKPGALGAEWIAARRFDLVPLIPPDVP